MLRSLTFLTLALVPALAILAGTPAVAAEKCDLPLVFEDDFEKGADHWQPTDPAAWRIVETDRGKVYNQFKNSDYKPPHRSPLNISLVKDVTVGDFVLTVKVQSTNKGAGAHRDMCLFFNYQDPAHFYYVHMGFRPDPHSSQIMIVNGAPRVMITKNKTPGVPWDDEWHQVKIVRRMADGAIEIYFDDMQKPMMIASDKTFAWGQVGIGSFDDNGNWDDFKLCGKKAEKNVGEPIAWRTTEASSHDLPYDLLEATLDYADGVSLHIKYRRTGRIDDSKVKLSGRLGVEVYFVRGVDDPEKPPRIDTGGVRQFTVRDGWTYMGSSLLDKANDSEKGAFAFIEPPENRSFPVESGDVSVPIAGSEKIPFFGEGMLAVYLADSVSWKDRPGVGFRQLSDTMGMPVRFAAKSGRETRS